MRRCLLPLLLRHLCDREGLTRDLIQYLLRLIDRTVTPRSGGKGCLPVDRLDLPVGLRDEVLYLLRSLDDKGKCRRLYTSDREQTSGVPRPILKGIEPSRIDPKEPVSDRSRHAGIVEPLILGRVVEVIKALSDRLFGHRREPETPDRDPTVSQLKYPALDQLSLLTGITTIDHLVSLGYKSADDVKLVLDAVILLKLDPKSLRHNRQMDKTPPPPPCGILRRLLQLTEVTKGPGDQVSIALHIAVVCLIGTQDSGNGARHRGFLSDTDLHPIDKGRDGKDRFTPLSHPFVS